MTVNAPDAAVDNDVLIKASSYGFADRLDAGRSLGVLGVATFVVARRLERMPLSGDREAARTAALALISRCDGLEPTLEEEMFASQLETEALLAGLQLDAGESQLAAIVLERGIAMLETGDKRAIRALEALLDHVPRLGDLCGRLRCLEQIAARCAAAFDPDEIAHMVCREPDVDKTMSICCGCFGPDGPILDLEGLASYIESLRVDASRVLEP